MNTPPHSRLAARTVATADTAWAVHEAALARRAAGEDVILLTVGDPDFPTPAPINNYAAEQLAAERTHYSPAAGEPELRRVIAELESRIEGRRFEPEQVVIYPGATAALYITFATLVDPGASVVIAEPMYLGYAGIFAALGITVKPVPMPASHGFAVDAERLLAAITPDVRAVLINTPGNPAGNVISAATLQRLAAGCAEAGVWLVCDEVYSLVTFDAPHVSLLRAADRLDHVVVIDGLSKSHAMAGWRIGWSVTPASAAAALAAVAGAVFFGCSQFAQDAAAFALARDEPFVAAMREEYHVRRDLVVSHIDATPGLSCAAPAGGMFVMVDVSRVAPDGDAFAWRMLEAAGVATLPGRAFGASTRTHVRISLTQPRAVLGAALTRIAAALAAHGPG